jgi:hypothetical protein
MHLVRSGFCTSLQSRRTLRIRSPCARRRRRGAAVEIGLPTLYTVFDGGSYAEHFLELESATPGLTLYSATVG